MLRAACKTLFANFSSNLYYAVSQVTRDVTVTSVDVKSVKFSLSQDDFIPMTLS